MKVKGRPRKQAVVSQEKKRNVKGLSKVKSSAVSKNKEHDSKYYTNFDFFYKRTCFRIMTLFYKINFKPFLDKWQNKKKGNLSVMPLLEEFAV